MTRTNLKTTTEWLHNLMKRKTSSLGLHDRPNELSSDVSQKKKRRNDIIIDHVLISGSLSEELLDPAYPLYVTIDSMLNVPYLLESALHMAKDMKQSEKYSADQISELYWRIFRYFMMKNFVFDLDFVKMPSNPLYLFLSISSFDTVELFCRWYQELALKIKESKELLRNEELSYLQGSCEEAMCYLVRTKFHAKQAFNLYHSLTNESSQRYDHVLKQLSKTFRKPGPSLERPERFPLVAHHNPKENRMVVDYCPLFHRIGCFASEEDAPVPDALEFLINCQTFESALVGQLDQGRSTVAGEGLMDTDQDNKRSSTVAFVTQAGPENEAENSVRDVETGEPTMDVIDRKDTSVAKGQQDDIEMIYPAHDEIQDNVSVPDDHVQEDHDIVEAESMIERDGEGVAVEHEGEESHSSGSNEKEYNQDQDEENFLMGREESFDAVGNGESDSNTDVRDRRSVDPSPGHMEIHDTPDGEFFDAEEGEESAFHEAQQSIEDDAEDVLGGSEDEADEDSVIDAEIVDHDEHDPNNSRLEEADGIAQSANSDSSDNKEVTMHTEQSDDDAHDTFNNAKTGEHEVEHSVHVQSPDRSLAFNEDKAEPDDRDFDEGYLAAGEDDHYVGQKSTGEVPSYDSTSQEETISLAASQRADVLRTHASQQNVMDAPGKVQATESAEMPSSNNPLGDLGYDATAEESQGHTEEEDERPRTAKALLEDVENARTKTGSDRSLERPIDGYEGEESQGHTEEEEERFSEPMRMADGETERSSFMEEQTEQAGYLATAEEESQEEEEDRQTEGLLVNAPSPALHIPQDQHEQKAKMERHVLFKEASSTLDAGYLPEDAQDHTEDEVPQNRVDGYQGGDSSIGQTEDEGVPTDIEDDGSRRNVEQEPPSSVPQSQQLGVHQDTQSLSGMSAADDRTMGRQEYESSELDEVNEKQQTHKALGSLQDYAAAAQMDFADTPSVQQSPEKNGQQNDSSMVDPIPTTFRSPQSDQKGTLAIDEPMEVVESSGFDVLVGKGLKQTAPGRDADIDVELMHPNTRDDLYPKAGNDTNDVEFTLEEAKDAPVNDLAEEAKEISKLGYDSLPHKPEERVDMAFEKEKSLPDGKLMDRMEDAIAYNQGQPSGTTAGSIDSDNLGQESARETILKKSNERSSDSDAVESNIRHGDLTSEAGGPVLASQVSDPTATHDSAGDEMVATKSEAPADEPSFEGRVSEPNETKDTAGDKGSDGPPGVSTEVVNDVKGLNDTATENVQPVAEGKVSEPPEAQDNTADEEGIVPISQGPTKVSTEVVNDEEDLNVTATESAEPVTEGKVSEPPEAEDTAGDEVIAPLPDGPPKVSTEAINDEEDLNDTATESAEPVTEGNVSEPPETNDTAVEEGVVPISQGPTKVSTEVVNDEEDLNDTATENVEPVTEGKVSEPPQENDTAGDEVSAPLPDGPTKVSTEVVNEEEDLNDTATESAELVTEGKVSEPPQANDTAGDEVIAPLPDGPPKVSTEAVHEEDLNDTATESAELVTEGKVSEPPETNDTAGDEVIAPLPDGPPKVSTEAVHDEEDLNDTATESSEPVTEGKVSEPPETNDTAGDEVIAPLPDGPPKVSTEVVNDGEESNDAASENFDMASSSLAPIPEDGALSEHEPKVPSTESANHSRNKEDSEENQELASQAKARSDSVDGHSTGSNVIMTRRRTRSNSVMSDDGSVVQRTVTHGEENKLDKVAEEAPLTHIVANRSGLDTEQSQTGRPTRRSTRKKHETKDSASGENMKSHVDPSAQVHVEPRRSTRQKRKRETDVETDDELSVASSTRFANKTKRGRPGDKEEDRKKSSHKSSVSLEDDASVESVSSKSTRRNPKRKASVGHEDDQESVVSMGSKSARKRSKRNENRNLPPQYPKKQPSAATSTKRAVRGKGTNVDDDEGSIASTKGRKSKRQTSSKDGPDDDESGGSRTTRSMTTRSSRAIESTSNVSQKQKKAPPSPSARSTRSSTRRSSRNK